MDQLCYIVKVDVGCMYADINGYVYTCMYHSFGILSYCYTIRSLSIILLLTVTVSYHTVIGADSSMLPKCVDGQFTAACQKHIDAFAVTGLRTLGTYLYLFTSHIYNTSSLQS